MRPTARLVIGLLGATVLLGTAAPARAELDRAEAVVLAGFIFNFTRFTEWPVGAFRSESEPLTVCLAGGEEIREASRQLIGRLVNGREYRIRAGSVRPNNIEGCKLLFIEDEDPARAGSLIRAVAGAPVLTVGLAPGFLEEGGTIRLLSVDNRFVFEVNQGAARRLNLRMAASLLALARRVLN